MGKHQKPKAKSGERSTRSNGKAPKKNPKTNPVTDGKRNGGYSEAALARRAARRTMLSPLAPILRPGRFRAKKGS
jgi:hypothetical protein